MKRDSAPAMGGWPKPITPMPNIFCERQRGGLREQYFESEVYLEDEDAS